MMPETRQALKESQRDSATKPRVARDELPWVKVAGASQPQRGCGRVALPLLRAATLSGLSSIARDFRVPSFRLHRVLQCSRPKVTRLAIATSHPDMSRRPNKLCQAGFKPDVTFDRGSCSTGCRQKC